MENNPEEHFKTAIFILRTFLVEFKIVRFEKKLRNSHGNDHTRSEEVVGCFRKKFTNLNDLL